MNLRTPTYPLKQKKFGFYLLGILMSIFGGLLLFGFGILLVAAAYTMDIGFFLCILFSVGLGVLLLYKGVRRCYLYRFGIRVQAIVQNKPRQSLHLLAQMTQKNYTQLVTGLRNLVKIGIYPQGYVDLNRREFVVVPGSIQPPIAQERTKLTEKRRRSIAPVYAIAITFLVYALYFPMYRWFDFVIAGIAAVLVCIIVAKFAPDHSIIIEEERKIEPPKPPEKIDTGNEELDQVLTKAMTYMQELTALDAAITNPKIDRPVQELVHIATQIFDYVKKCPQNVHRIRQFMNYYLPTTISLLKNYEELSRERVKGDNIQAAMGKIEDAMDTILKTFRKELDDLYEDKAIDISVDIEVLQGMMEEEGLGDRDIRSMMGEKSE